MYRVGAYDHMAAHRMRDKKLIIVTYDILVEYYLCNYMEK
jgi:hypothetical protein